MNVTEEQLPAEQGYMFSNLHSYESSSSLSWRKRPVANQKGQRKREVGTQVPGQTDHKRLLEIERHPTNHSTQATSRIAPEKHASPKISGYLIPGPRYTKPTWSLYFQTPGCAHLRDISRR